MSSIPGALLLATLIIASGCVGTGEKLEQPEPIAGAPDITEVLEALAQNDAQIQNFRAGGASTVRSPQLEATQRFRSGVVMFERPNKLFVEGRLLIGTVAFRLTSVEDEYLIEFPVRREYFGSIEGVDVEPIPFEVAPVEIAREMFFPIEWSAVNRRRAHILAFDAATSRLTFRIGTARRPERVVTVQGPQWVVIENERYEDGRLVASTRSSAHNIKDGIAFPTSIEAVFPEQQTEMSFTMRNIRHNTPIDPVYFSIDDDRLQEIGLKRPRTARNR